MIERLKAELTVPRLKSVGKVIYEDIVRCDMLKQATAMAYVTLLSLVPSLVVVFVVVSNFSPMLGRDGALVDQARTYLLENLAAGSGQQVIQYLNDLVSSLDLAKIGWASFAGALVSLIMLLAQIEAALNQVWMVRKGRNIFMRFIYFWTFLTLGVFAVALIVGLSSGFDVNALFDFDDGIEAMKATGLVTWFVTFAFFFLVYKIVPNSMVSFREAAVGGLVASLLFTLAGQVYGWYAQDFSNYEKLYGAIAAIPVFLMWLYICWLIILFGAVLAWRSAQGIPREAETNAVVESATSPFDHYRNLQLRGVVPSICLVAIYLQFSRGTGKGLSTRDLGVQLKLPTDWVQDALETLVQMGYVVETAAGEEEVVRYFPTYPPEALQAEKFVSELSQPADDWLKTWSSELSDELRQALQRMLPLHRQGGAGGGTLAQLFAH